MKKTIVFLLTALLVLGTLAGCGGESPHGDPNANKTVPEGYKRLEIEQDSNGKQVLGVGTELDPHFLSCNAGLSGTFQPDSKESGEKWEVKASDWDDIFVPRMKEMNLKRIRTMVLPHYFCPNEAAYTSKTYDWQTTEMKSLYQVLDTAQELEMYVNLTMWGVDTSHSAWLAAGDSGTWCCEPQEGKEEIFAELFATMIKYLREEKGYTCIQEITLYNEPNSFYNRYGAITGHELYTEMCIATDEAFKEAGIRQDVKFNLSDDARDSTWLGKSAATLEGVADILNSHTYDFTEEHTNAQIQYELPTYNLKSYMDAIEDSLLPHMFGEFGTGHVEPPSIATDRHTEMRGLQIARIAANMLYMGSCGFSHWPLFSQYYNRPSSDFVTAYPFEIMNMGLWGYADEDYAPRPVYYAYSLLSRFVQMGAHIYPVETNDANLVAVALKTAEGKWTYLVVNDSAETKNIAFVNNTKFPASLNRYVYELGNVPTDGKQIQSNKTVTADGRVVSDRLGGMTFAVYSDLESGGRT